ncbi:hypothetical protein OC846_003868 [Tilletia horrida]|uniref:GAR domain-containing protein n=1 Tax=Tilletia horrida TaxID=155126 RepID=A0AAN6GPR4_9BASI|nr:hypothetical protein OC846_003868 [Tilletia horrida]KAK0565044.1 hypothetical protein OC861_003969 [Tilletia horrida]
MEINITPATPAIDSDPSASAFPAAITSTAELSTQLNDIESNIDAVKGLLFQIQEQRHQQSFTAVSSNAAADQTAANSDIDKALIQLDTYLEQISKVMLHAEQATANLVSSSPLTEDIATLKKRERRESTASSSSSLDSFDDDLLQTGISTNNTVTLPQLQAKLQDVQADWIAITTEADTLKRELSEDKYLLVFRTVSDQADSMMTSLHKAITLCHDFVTTYKQQHQTSQLPSSDTRLSLDGSDTPSPEAQLEELRAIKKTFNVKTSYYGPACEQVFHVLERGIKDKATSNGTILHRYADLKMRWKSTREDIMRTDRDLTKIERHLCKILGMETGASGQPDHSQQPQHQTEVTSPLSINPRQRKNSATSTSTPPRPQVQPKSSARTLRHVPSSTPSDSSFSTTTASPSQVSRSSALHTPRSPPAPSLPPRSELRRLPSSQRLGTTGSSPSASSGAIPIPTGRGASQSQQQSQYSFSYGSAPGRTIPHRRSISASANETMADPANRRASVMGGVTGGTSSYNKPNERPPIPPRSGSRTGARTPLSSSNNSTSTVQNNPFKHTGSEYSYSVLTAGRNLGSLGGGHSGTGSPASASPRRGLAGSPTHPPSSYRLSMIGGSGVGSGGSGIAPRRSKTPQPGPSQLGGAGSRASYYGGASSTLSTSMGRGDRGASEPPEFGHSSRPGSRTSSRAGSGLPAASATGPGGTIRAAGLGRYRAGGYGVESQQSSTGQLRRPLHQSNSAAFDDAMEDVSLESYDGPPSPVRQRPASSMGTYYHPPTAHGQRPGDTHIPRLAVAHSSVAHHHAGLDHQSSSSSLRSPTASLVSLGSSGGPGPAQHATPSGRPGSSLSQASRNSHTTAGNGATTGAGRRASVMYQGASRLTMQTPEPALAAQVQRLSLFARPSHGLHNHQHTSSIGGPGANSSSTNGGGLGVRKSSRPPPARLNNTRVGPGGPSGRTTPLSAAALAAVPQANPALAWMKEAGGGLGGAGPGSSPSHSLSGGGGVGASSSVAAFRAQRAAAGGHHNGGAGSGSNTRAETPLSDSSFGGQSVGGWGVRPARTGGYSRAGMMSSATGGAGGGAGSFDVYVPNVRDALDVAVAEVVNSLGVAIERVDDPLPRGVRAEVAPGKDIQARYSIAGKTVQCKLLMLHRPAGAAGHRAGTNVKKLLVRVGGGWQDFESWLSSLILG